MAEKTKILLQSFQFNQNWIIFADTKAAAILTINGLLIGFIVPLGKLLKTLSSYSFGFMLTLYIIYLLVALSSLIFSALVIYPRPHRRGEISALFNIAAVQQNYPKPEDSDRYSEKFLETDTEEIMKEYAALLHREYLVSSRKYNYVKKAILSFLVSAIFAVVLFVVSTIVI
ncbi:hypothetical protein [Candidatus Uabimicrobium sp. HlEnr_7]|uniref:hypothetical protein n=1 Tax=Candidatus Uabimicrobium helgolandensis TaxID=3095367 RepID=UPI0035579ADF